MQSALRGGLALPGFGVARTRHCRVLRSSAFRGYADFRRTVDRDSSEYRSRVRPVEAVTQIRGTRQYRYTSDASDAGFAEQQVREEDTDFSSGPKPRVSSGRLMWLVWLFCSPRKKNVRIHPQPSHDPLDCVTYFLRPPPPPHCTASRAHRMMQLQWLWNRVLPLVLPKSYPESVSG